MDIGRVVGVVIHPDSHVPGHLDAGAAEFGHPVEKIVLFLFHIHPHRETAGPVGVGVIPGREVSHRLSGDVESGFKVRQQILRPCARRHDEALGIESSPARFDPHGIAAGSIPWTMVFSWMLTPFSRASAASESTASFAETKPPVLSSRTLSAPSNVNWGKRSRASPAEMSSTSTPSCRTALM